VGDPIPKEMSVKPQWDNTARIVHTLDAITYRLSTEHKDKKVLLKFSQHLQLELQYQHLPHLSVVALSNERLNSSR
jgi:hypothetical protein